MQCPAQERFLALIEGRLDETELSSLHEHIARCGSCMSRLSVLLAGRTAQTESVLRSTELFARITSGEPTGAPHSFAGTERFAILRLLGAGGMGVVYEAHDRQLDTRVALKTLRYVDAPMLLRLKNEFRALADIHHRNLVQLHELTHDAGHWFFTMELVRGENFLRYVRAAPDRLDVERLRAALAQLSDGLDALHRAGKVHCDIKPSNVLVEPGGRVALLDFGLVSETVSEGHHGQYPLGGTPEYMAPEQATAASVDGAADWYAVGSMLFQALTDRFPFIGERRAIVVRKQREDPPRPSALDASIPADLDALCRDLLQREPRARPTGDQVRARLGRAPTASRVLDEAGAPFVGRAAELARLHAALQASANHAVVVLVDGESGVGKSALVRRFAEEAGRSGALVLTGRCYERESVPYKALDGVVDALSRVLADLPPAEAASLWPADTPLLLQAFPVLDGAGAPTVVATSHVPPDPIEQRQRLFAALRLLLTGLAARGAPLVVVIDDLQWSDADSLALLGELVRAPSLLLVATMRPGTAIRLDCAVQALSLPPLDAADARMLAVRLLGDGDLDAAALAKEAGGHPLFIAELARRARAPRTGQLTLDEALRHRIGELGAEPRAVLELLALAAGPLRPELLARAAGQPIEAHARHVAELRAAHLVRTTAAALETYHDRVRAAALAHLDEPRRRRWHQRLATTLESSGRADPEALVVHLAGAGEPVRAAEHAVRAAAQAATALAFERAAQLYRKALELDPARADARALYTQLGDALVNAGRQGEAGDAYLAAAGSAERAAALDLKRRAAEQLLGGGRTEEGLVILDEVLRSVGLARPRSPLRALVVTVALRARLQLRGLRFVVRDERDLAAAERERLDICRSAATGLLACDPWGGFEFHTRTLLHALDAGEPGRLAQVMASEISFAALAGPLGRRRTRALTATAERLAARVDRPIVHAQLELAKGLSAFYDGRWRASESELALAEKLLREQCTGVAGDLNTLAIFRFSTLFFRGEIDQMRPMLARVVRDAAERRDRFGDFLFRTAISAVVRLADDDLEEGWRQARIAAELDAHSPQAMHYAPKLMGEALLDLYGDDPTAAWARLRAGWRGLEETHALRPQWFRVLFWHLRGSATLAAAAASAPSERRHLLHEARHAARRLERERAAWIIPLGLLVRAGAQLLANDQASAATLLAQAEQGFEAAEMTLHAMVARCRRGQILGGDAGGKLVASADDWFRRQRIRDPLRFCRLFLPAGPLFERRPADELRTAAAAAVGSRD